MKELGSVVIGDGGPGVFPDEEEAAIVAGGQMAGLLGGDPEKTLQDAKFVIGDYVSCAIMPPMSNGSVAPPPQGPARGGFGAGRGMDFGGRGMGPRENGFGGFRGRGGPRGAGNFGQGTVPAGEWRRGERVPEGADIDGFIRNNTASLPYGSRYTHSLMPKGPFVKSCSRLTTPHSRDSRTRGEMAHQQS
jgi:histone deacetylase complex subunit SAP18